MFQTVLIANRGAIARRVTRTLRALGVRAVAVYTRADAGSLHVADADEAVAIGDGPAAESYLDAARILEAARATGATAVHPGYGFLSENPAFAEACEQAGIAFIGPTPEQMRAFGLKHSARELARQSGVPLLPGSGLLTGLEQALAEARHVGYPVMLKSTAGGGGIGMQLCQDEVELASAYDSVARLARNNFAEAGLFLERYVGFARHIEVQIFGDGEGGVLALGERDCSVQRRNQKVIEETPAPSLPDHVRAKLRQAAIALGERVRYRSAGTVEFVYDGERERCYFLEVNTRLQVEHGVTEEVFGVDLVEWMVRLAAGELPPLAELAAGLAPRGHAIQARVYAEDPAKGYQPCAGLLTRVELPEDPGVRVETWVEAGVQVPQFYDPMLAKVIVHDVDREAALARLATALAATRVDGIETNLGFLGEVLAHPVVRRGEQYTRLLEGFRYRPGTVEVLDGGTQTTVQDHPGRVGYWDVGVPPSGPMDDLSFRLGNRLLGNPAGAAGLELTLNGPTLRFNREAVVALTGAPMAATLDGAPVPFWTALRVPAGGLLRIGAATGAGARAYLCVRGGLEVPEYLGSRATFTLGGFGGHAGRALRAGDALHLGHDTGGDPGGPLPPELRPTLASPWTLRVVYGPHGAPDFFTARDIEEFFAADWEVHYNSSRTGIRLIGPKPEWARVDGGEAGLHPSNIHDNAYAVGSIDFTGDMPVVLGPDGPSLGGFVCPATVMRADRWKLGQLKAGDRVRFVPVSIADALDLYEAQETGLRELTPVSAGRDRLTRDLRALEETVAPSSEGGVPGAVSPDRVPPGRRHTNPQGWIHRVSRGAAPATPAAGRGPAIPAQALTPVPLRVSGVAAGKLMIQDLTPLQAFTYRAAGDDYLLVEIGPPVLDIRLRARVHALMGWVQGRGLPGILDLTPGVRSLQVHYDPSRLPLARLLAELEQAEDELARVDDLELPARIVHLPLSWDDPSTRLAIDKYMQSVRADAPWCPSNIEFIRRINGLDSVEEVRRIVFEASYLVLGLGDVYLGAPVATPLDPRHRLVTTKYNPARTWTPENAVGIGGSYLCVYGMEGPGGYQFVGRTLQMWNRYRRTPEFPEGRPWLLRFFDQIRFYPVSARELESIRADFPLGRHRLRIEETTFRLRPYEAFLEAEAESIAAFRSRQQRAFGEERERWEAMGLRTCEAAGEAIEETAEEEPLPADAVGVDSPVAGSIWQVLVRPGERVEPGQPLVVVESMKMEIAVEAQAAGTVAQVLCPVGTQVSPGRRLLVLERR